MKRDIRNSAIEKNIPNEVELKKKIRLEIMKKLQAVSINHLISKSKLIVFAINYLVLLRCMNYNLKNIAFSKKQ